MKSIEYVSFGKFTLMHVLKTITIALLLPFCSNSQIVINEIMASQDSLGGLPDEYGEFDDWVELYNKSNSAISLSDYFISDNSNDLMKWQIPSGTSIPGNGFLIIWTDKDENNGQVPLHTNFKLSAAGEKVLISNPFGEAIDSVVFGQQTTNLSYARKPNGTGDFFIGSPTFNSENQASGLENILSGDAVNIYPNPTSGSMKIDLLNDEFIKGTYEIIDYTGKIYSTDLFNSSFELDLEALAAGQYMIRLKFENGQILKPFTKL